MTTARHSSPPTGTQPAALLHKFSPAKAATGNWHRQPGTAPLPKTGFREQHDNIYRRLLKIIEKVTIPALACAAAAILAKRPAISAGYRQKTRLITKADAYWLAV